MPRPLDDAKGYTHTHAAVSYLDAEEVVHGGWGRGGGPGEEGGRGGGLVRKGEGR